MLSRDRLTLAWINRRLRPVLERGELPPLGSGAWLALDDTDPRKLAAVLRSALAWWWECRPEVIAQRLRDELAVAAQLEQQAFEHVAHDVRRSAGSPTWAEIRSRWAS